MLLYYLFWMLMDLLLHFYIIFGTNRLTGGPAQIDETWSGRQETIEEAMRQGARPPSRVRPPPSWSPHCSTNLLLPPIYIHIPTSIQEHHENLIPPPQPSVPKRSHLGAFSGAPPEGESIAEGFYINTIVSLMMCE